MVDKPGSVARGDASEERQAEVERDFYRHVARLASAAEPRELIDQALDLLVGLTDSRRGYIEISKEGERGSSWSASNGCRPDQVGAIRKSISTGIIAHALSTGEHIQTAQASLDPRFGERESIRARGISTVLCAPVGCPPIGVVYLQDRSNGSAYTDEMSDAVMTLANLLAPLAERLMDLTVPTRRAECQTLKAEMNATSVVGESQALLEVLHRVKLIAPLEVSVLLTGPTGTGKTMLARLIHENGGRTSGPFVEVNCAALPEGLVESELFGARAGSHSTAFESRRGRVHAAEGGTLFLDEIAELPLTAQAKLLQLLQSGTYHPLGEQDVVASNVRIIAATNSDLERAVGAGKMREDLYYRLNVVPIAVPTLAQRRADIGALARHFLSSAAARHGVELAFSPGALGEVELAPWPGNVRQLAHAVERAVVNARLERRVVVEARHILEGPETADSESSQLSLQSATRHFQKRFLQRALDARDWNISKTARELSLARSYLYKLIRNFSLEP